jgi:hypothetical protein
MFAIESTAAEKEAVYAPLRLGTKRSSKSPSAKERERERERTNSSPFPSFSKETTESVLVFRKLEPSHS